MSFEITRREIFETLMSSSSTSWNLRYQTADMFIQDKILHIDFLSTTLKSELRKQYSKIKKRWEGCDRKKERFFEKYSNWLNTVITVSLPGNSSIIF